MWRESRPPVGSARSSCSVKTAANRGAKRIDVSIDGGAAIESFVGPAYELALPRGGARLGRHATARWRQLPDARNGVSSARKKPMRRKTRGPRGRARRALRLAAVPAIEADPDRIRRAQNRAVACRSGRWSPSGPRRPSPKPRRCRLLPPVPRAMRWPRTQRFTPLVRTAPPSSEAAKYRVSRNATTCRFRGRRRLPQVVEVRAHHRSVSARRLRPRASRASPPRPAGGECGSARVRIRASTSPCRPRTARRESPAPARARRVCSRDG